MPTRYLAEGEGPPLILLHGVGDNALVWDWVIPALARTHRVYAPDLPGSGGSARPRGDDYSPASFGRFLAAFLDALGVERAAVVGNSLGGLVGLRLALTDPDRVTALVLIAGAGLGRGVSPALRSLALPGYGGLAVAWGKRPPGAVQRALGRAALLFGSPRRIPVKWLKEQYKLARLPGFLEGQLATVRAQVGLRGQREILLDRLSSLRVPTLVVWGERDRVLPPDQAREAISRIPDGSLELIPDCGHLPQVERPDHVAQILVRFLSERGGRASG
ncbi:MAG: alpha/beta fold hydrolase [Actinomycetota bacterium]|nr:alpha/beta fold hydrolase [Actinomycetota bacterium]